MIQKVNTLASLITVSYTHLPAAAVIRRWRALSGFIGRKASAAGLLSLELKPGAQLQFVLETDRLECGRGKRNF